MIDISVRAVVGALLIGFFVVACVSGYNSIYDRGYMAKQQECDQENREREVVEKALLDKRKGEVDERNAKTKAQYEAALQAYSNSVTNLVNQSRVDRVRVTVQECRSGNAVPGDGNQGRQRAIAEDERLTEARLPERNIELLEREFKLIKLLQVECQFLKDVLPLASE